MSAKSAQKKTRSNLNKRETNQFRWPIDGFSEYLDEAFHLEDRLKAYQDYVQETKDSPDSEELQLDDDGYKELLAKPALTTHEFACLLIGRDPEKFDWELAKHYVNANNTVRKYAFIQEKIQQSEFRGYEYINLKSGINWADEEIVRLPAQLHSVRKETQNISLKNDELNPNERKALYRIILGMAIFKYGYRPNKRTGAHTALLKDLKDVNCQVDSNTLSKHLSNAIDEVPNADFDGEINNADSV